jgi:hypothetical protein
LTVLVLGFGAVLLDVDALSPVVVIAIAVPVAIVSAAIAWILAPRIAGLPERHA